MEKTEKKFLSFEVETFKRIKILKKTQKIKDGFLTYKTHTDTEHIRTNTYVMISHTYKHLYAEKHILRKK